MPKITLLEILTALKEREDVIGENPAVTVRAAFPEFTDEDVKYLFDDLVAETLVQIIEGENLPDLFITIFLRGVEMGRELERRAP